MKGEGPQSFPRRTKKTKDDLPRRGLAKSVERERVDDVVVLLFFILAPIVSELEVEDGELWEDIRNGRV